VRAFAYLTATVLIVIGVGVGIGVIAEPNGQVGPMGVVTGRVWACEGMFPPHPVMVNVNVTRGDVVVASAELVSGHRYRFRLSPGRYTLSSPPGGSERTVEVRVAARHVNHADIYNACK
jgi:hypothetical protein